MADFAQPISYNQGGTTSSIGGQLVEFYYHKKAIIDVAKEQVFAQLADTMTMPKHMGKTIKVYHYLPVIDDRNTTDQGIDATGASIANQVTIILADTVGNATYRVGYGADAAAALAAAKASVVEFAKYVGISGATYDTIKTAFTTAGWTVVEGDAVPASGNLWGSSKDIGNITSGMPIIGEHGGRKNRVGFTRKTIQGSIHPFGFFHEYTEDSLQFDSDKQLKMHITREAYRAAKDIMEVRIQIDLINGAGVLLLGGEALQTSQLNANSGLSYGMMVKAGQILKANKCPVATKIITGSTLTDTKVVGATRYAYCGLELLPSLLAMKNYHGEKAFIEVQHYADAAKTANGEIGSVGNFRFIEALEMVHWAGVGATATEAEQGEYYTTGGKFDAFPILIVGNGSFTTIGFQTAGNANAKMNIIHKAPGVSTADRNDPYGLTGFYSYRWWYGSMVLRPERIALLKVTAKYEV